MFWVVNLENRSTINIRKINAIAVYKRRVEIKVE